MLSPEKVDAGEDVLLDMVKRQTEEIEILKKQVLLLQENQFAGGDKDSLFGMPKKDAELFPEGLTEGLNVGVGATFILQGTSKGNRTEERKDEHPWDATLSVDIGIEKTFDEWGMAFAGLEYDNGGGLDGNGRVQLFSDVNGDVNGAGSTVDVSEAWYEHYFIDKKFIVTAGKIDPYAYVDDNAYANDETVQFLNCAFINNTALDNGARIDNGPGIRIAWKPVDWCNFNLVGGTAGGAWDNAGNNLSGIGQVTFSPSWLKNNEGGYRGCNYRFYGWYTHACDDFPEWDKTGQTNRDYNYGFGISCDQELNDMIGVFGRFGWANPKVSIVEYSWSSGLQLNGRYWGRENDVIAAGIGQNIPGNKWAGTDNNGGDRGEGIFEIYYNFHVNEYLTVSPDFQVIWNPCGAGSETEGPSDNMGRNKTVYIYGMRGQMNF
ncbi:MAG: carbohydrate porin [bacterium]|nr:carbohydrate porin [bacterium]